MTDRVTRNAKTVGQSARADGISDGYDGMFAHDRHIAKLVSKGQANMQRLPQNNLAVTTYDMGSDSKPFADIAARLQWHRTLEGLTQDAYAAKIGTKRSTYSLWEAGSHRLSLDGALALRHRFGLSLDFMYEGIDDALPMTLRNAWRDKP